MFVSSWIAGLANAPKVLALRREVFLEEAGINKAQEFDWFDGIAMHLLVEDQESGQTIACGRMYPDAGATRFGRIAVAQPYRDQLYDDLVLRIMLDKAQRLAGDPIIGEAERGQVALFAQFGFKAAQEVASAPGRVCMSVPKDGVIWNRLCEQS